MTLRELLEYEVQSSWLASHANWPWAQRLLADHFARKVRRKVARIESQKALLKLAREHLAASSPEVP